METKKDNKSFVVLLIVLIIILLALCAGLFYYWHRSATVETEMAEMVEQMTYEKEQLETEYQDLSLEMEGLSYKIDNDSLLQLLDKEQQHVQLLLEELRTVKATNARRIADLKKELASVRKVLLYYVSQVDSLNMVNAKLVTENQEVTQRYEAVSRTAEQLAADKQRLTEQVQIAAQLEARNIVVTTLNKRERKTTRLSKIALIQFDFTIVKNITAEPGNKVVYLRLVTPDDVVLQRSGADTFPFENRLIAYSSKRSFEYAGEDLPLTIYWTVDQLLQAGNYRVDLFVDGHLIGSKSFLLE